MMTFSLHVCSHGGDILHKKSLEARDVYGALARANRRAAAIARGLTRLPVETPDRIDVADQHGQTVARLLWSEAIHAGA